IAAGGRAALDGADEGHPIVLVIDEYQWLPELVGLTSSTTEWQQTWIAFIEQHCALNAVALGTAHGTLAAYACNLAAKPSMAAPRLVGGQTTYETGPAVLRQTPDYLAQWKRYDDPRRTAGQEPEVKLTTDGLEVAGTGWPGIQKIFAATPG